MKTAICSGYFNPIHTGHLESFKYAKSIADKLYVIVNNDDQQMLKINKIFMDEDTRLEIVKSIKYVDDAFISCSNDKTIISDIEQFANVTKIDYLVKGGDRLPDEIPEKDVCDKYNIKIVYSGDKVDSSSNYR